MYRYVVQASTNPLRVMVHHLRDEKYSATDDIIKVHSQFPFITRHFCSKLT